MRLVKNNLNTTQHNILNYMKENCVSKKNALQGFEIAKQFNIAPETFRRHIKKIRTFGDIIIATCRDGYYIPLASEYEDGVKYANNKLLSELESRIKTDRRFANLIFKKMHEILNETDYIQQDQTQMKLTGYENDFYNKFGDKYLKGEQL